MNRKLKIGSQITVYKIGELLGKAYEKSTTLAIVEKRFLATGILPYIL